MENYFFRSVRCVYTIGQEDTRMLKKLFFIFLPVLSCVADDIRISMQQTQITGTPLAAKGMSFEWDNGRSYWALAGKILVGAYVCTTAYLLYARYLLNNLCAWNNWKNSVSLSDLALLPQNDVYGMLMKSIQVRYNCPSGTHTMNIPQFLQDTAIEIEVLSSYKIVAHALSTVYLAPLFFISTDAVRQAEEKIKRLRFMQSVVIGELDMHEYAAVQRCSFFSFGSRKGLCVMRRA